jgi:threonine-phosphate decarboxylase
MDEVTVDQHGGNLFEAARQTGKSLHELIDFSANINPMGIPASVRKALNESLERIIHYPDAGAYDLKQAISMQYKVERERITVGNGAIELIYILCHMLKPKRVLVTAPTFSEYERAARAAGAAVDYVFLSPATNFKPDIVQMANQLENMDMVFICNPNNPTGVLLTNEEIKLLLAAAQRSNTMVVVDESFIDFLTDERPYTCKSLLECYSNLVILHSLTKFYAIPGLRLGFLLANPHLTGLLHAGKDPWNVNTLAQAAGIAALQDAGYRRESKKYMDESKRELYARLRLLSQCRPFFPAANFILVELETLTSGQVCVYLKNQGILIRDCENYPGLSGQYIRVAVKKPEQHEQLVKGLKRVLGDMG